MTNHRSVCSAALVALFSLGLASAALAQAKPATPPASAEKGQTMKDEKTAKDKAAKKKRPKARKRAWITARKPGWIRRILADPRTAFPFFIFRQHAPPLTIGPGRIAGIEATCGRVSRL